MREIGVMVYLAAGAYMDAKRKEISSAYLAAGGLFGGACFLVDIVGMGLSPIQGILRFLPGILFLLYSRLTKEKIGYGDGMLLLILGGCLESQSLWRVWYLGMLLHLSLVFLLLFKKRIQKDSRLPFLPSLGLSYGIVWGMNYVCR